MRKEINIRRAAYLAFYILLGVLWTVLDNWPNYDFIDFWGLGLVITIVLVWFIQFIDLEAIQGRQDSDAMFLGVVFGAVIISHTYCILNFIILSFQILPIFSGLTISLIVFSVVLFKLIWAILHKRKAFHNIIKLRQICITAFQILIYLCLNVMIVLGWIYTFSSFEWDEPVTDIFMTMLYISIISPYMCYKLIIPQIKDIFTRIKTRDIAIKQPYLLFLRCFTFDDDTLYDDILYRISLSIGHYYKILQVGNPKNVIKGNDSCITLYLPSIDWQKEVSHYVDSSSIIFLVINNTNGVLWEMLNHHQHINKFIFYVPENIEMESIIENEIFKKEVEANNPLAILINNNRALLNNHYFYFYDGILYSNENIFKTIVSYFELNSYLSWSKEIIEKDSFFQWNNPSRFKTSELISLGPE